MILAKTGAKVCISFFCISRIWCLHANTNTPLSLLYNKWLSDHKPQNLCDYVSTFRFRLHHACQLVKQNLISAQSKMKMWYDKNAKTVTFKPGDKALILLHVQGSALQMCFAGPYEVLEKLGSLAYIVATPDQRRQTRLCHINRVG